MPATRIITELDRYAERAPYFSGAEVACQVAKRLGIGVQEVVAIISAQRATEAAP